MLVATLCLIPVFVLEFDATGGWKQAAFVANWVIWGVFAVEFAAVMTRRTEGCGSSGPLC